MSERIEGAHVGVLAIVQARVSSKRLPAKVMRPLLGHPMLGRQLERLRRCRQVDKLMVATSNDPSDQPIADLCAAESVVCFRGSLDDVLDRFYRAAKACWPLRIVRLTGDCPLTDPELVDRVIDFHAQGSYDFVSNAIEPTFPDGLDVAVFNYSLLERTWMEAKLPTDREHVTPYMHRFPDRFKIGVYKGSPDRSHLRWTVDEPDDFEFVSKVYGKLYLDNPNFCSDDIYRLLEREPELLLINGGIGRNEGLLSALPQDVEWKARNENQHT